MKRTKQSKLLAVLLTVAMMLTLVPTVVFAADNSVCKIGETGYPSLTDAVYEAADGQEIVLLDSVELTEKLTINKKLTLNIGTYTLSSTVVSGAALDIKAEVTITGSGTIQGADRESNSPVATAYLLQVGSGAKLTLENVVVQPGKTQTGGSTASATTGIYVSGGTLVLNGATVKGGDSIGKGNGGYAVYVFGSSSQLTADDATMIGGAVERTGAVNNSGGRAVYIQNGNAVLNNCTLTGGSAKSTMEDYYSANGGEALYIQSAGTAVVTGGTLTGGASNQTNNGGAGGTAVYAPGGSKANLTFSDVDIAGGNSENGQGGNAIALMGPSTVAVKENSTVVGGNGGRYAGTAVNLGSYSATGTFSIVNSSVSAGAGPVFSSYGTAIDFGNNDSDDRIAVTVEGSVISGGEDGNSIYAKETAIEKGKLILKNSELKGSVMLSKVGGGYSYSFTKEQLSAMTNGEDQDIWQDENGNVQIGSAPEGEQDIRPIQNTTTGTYYVSLEKALAEADNGHVIKLLANIQYETNGTGLFNITKSITLDGDGHTITGYGKRASNSTTLAINNGGTDKVHVTLKNLKIVNDAPKGRAIETRGNIGSLTIEKCEIACTGGGNTQLLTVGGSQSDAAEIHIDNSTLDAGNAGYPIVVFNPMKLNITNESKLAGYCGVYFKGVDGSEGSHGSVLTAENSTFDCPNVHSGDSSDFGVFVLEDDNIKIAINNCVINAESKGTSKQAVLSESSYAQRHTEGYSITIEGDSTKVTGTLLRKNDNWEKRSFAVSGGVFSEEVPEELCAENFHPNKNEDGSFSVHVHTGAEAVKENEKAPTCTEKGSYDSVVYCSVCGEKMSSETKTIPETEHQYGSDWVSDETNHWHECSCGDKADEAAHTFGDWTVTKEATATEAGSREKVCTACGYKVTEEIPVGSEKPNPDTGDHNHLTLWISLLAVSAASLCTLISTSKKRSAQTK